jgi:hypothetical protein
MPIIIRSRISGEMFLPKETEYIIKPSRKLPIILTVRVPKGKDGTRLPRYLEMRKRDTAPMNPPTPT